MTFDQPELAAPAPSRARLKVGAVVVLVLLVVGAAIAVTSWNGAGSTEMVVPPVQPSVHVSSPAEVESEVFVHVLGAVERPGMFRLDGDARVVDAVAAAGGFGEDADHGSLNLARVVSDGEQIYVAAVGEVVPGPPASGPGVALGSQSEQKVNLNTADSTALETLPRIGPALAARILDWRTTNGRFATVDDLRSVSGIGDKMFAALESLVTV